MNNTQTPSDSKQAPKQKKILKDIRELLSNGEQADLFGIVLEQVTFTKDQLLHIEGLFDRYYEEMYGVHE